MNRDFKMKYQKRLKTTLLALLFAYTGQSFALARKLKLLTKRLENGTTHCVWGIYLIHESLIPLNYNSRKTIAQGDRNSILHFAKATNAKVLVEDPWNYNKHNIKQKNIINIIERLGRPIETTIEKIKTESFDHNQAYDVLEEITNFLETHDVDVENIECRQDAKTRSNLKLEAKHTIIRWITYYIIKSLLSSKKFNTSCKSINLLGNSAITFSQKALIAFNIYRTWNGIFHLIENLIRSRSYNQIEKTITQENPQDAVLFGNTKLKQKIIEKLKRNLKIEKYFPGTFLNNIITIEEILKREHRAPHNTFFHTLVVTGGAHTKKIMHILENTFGYEKKYGIRTPRFKNPYFGTAGINSRDKILTTLNIERFFEKGINLLLEEKRKLLSNVTTTLVQNYLKTQLDNLPETKYLQTIALKRKRKPIHEILIEKRRRKTIIPALTMTNLPSFALQNTPLTARAFFSNWLLIKQQTIASTAMLSPPSFDANFTPLAMQTSFRKYLSTTTDENIQKKAFRQDNREDEEEEEGEVN